MYIMKILSKCYGYFLCKIDHSLTKYYRFLGVNIGKNCSFVGRNISVSSEPYLITIGDNVRISFDVCFVTHDGGTHVLRNKYPNSAIYGKIKVGNNVFIGVRSIIMPGVVIEDNCIIGAGSIVTKKCESNGVYAGVPAKRICSIEEYESKNKDFLIPICNYNYKNKKRILLISKKVR